MKVTDVRTYFVDTDNALSKNFVFCRLETDDGTVGWGEAYAIKYRERGIVEFIKSLGGMVMSLEDASPRCFQKNLTDSYDKGHVGIDFSSACGAIEIALWDIQGKQAGKPVCELLGPVLKRSIPIYANLEQLTPDESIGDLVQRCLAAKLEGFTAVKIYPMDYGTLEVATACVRDVRHAIGPDTDLLLDLWALDSPEDALAAAAAFVEFNPFWFEEPIAGERISEMAAIRRKIDMPIVTGERQVGIDHFRTVVDLEAADILNPDIAGAGGITNIIEISTLADSSRIRISPHCWNSTLVATAAMIHAIAVIPNAFIGEYFPHYAPFCAELGELAISIKDGTAMIGDEPGLGVRMNEAALAPHEI